MPRDDSDNGSDSRLKPYIPSHVTPAIFERLNRLEQALSTLVTCVEDILTDTIAFRESDGSITSLSIDSDILQDLLENVWLGQLLAAVGSRL
jgi:archaellum component FlaC